VNIAVIGTGHLAAVIRVCLSEQQHLVWNMDDEPYLVRPDQASAAAEPDWPTGLGLRTASLASGFLETCDLVWVAYDTPLTPDGAPDLATLFPRLLGVLHTVPADVPVLISSQWPVGTTRRLAACMPDHAFYYVPENIRVGHALEDFRHQKRVVLGLPPNCPQPLPYQVTRVLDPFAVHLRYHFMSWASAEMTKHALNGFLSLNIAYANEIDRLCRAVDANGADVLNALLTEPRISPKAPLRPGAPFGGGSLQRDCRVLEDLVVVHDIWAPILTAILPSNDPRP
jgi:nucleotide sugar dehydrogenase